MVCGICKLSGHNRRTCQNINTIHLLDDYKINSSIQPTCIICFKPLKNATTTPCNHSFCSKCIFKSISFGNFNCPLCRKTLVTPKKFFKKHNKKEIERLQHKVKLLKYALRKYKCEQI